jgi:uncharacterized protein (DUF433 family)
VTDILEMLSENVSITEILEDFPDLELADIQACLIFTARRTDFPRLTNFFSHQFSARSSVC